MSKQMRRAAVAVVATMSVVAAGVTLTGVAPGAALTAARPAAARPATALLPTRAQVVASMRKANDYWISTHRKPGANDWNDAVYLHGDTAAYEDTHVAGYRTYALTWAEQNKFGLADGSTTRNADEQASGQVYLDLYADHPQTSDIAATRASVRSMVDSDPTDDWWWVDALYMGMPVFARLGVIGNHTAYYDKMYALFHSTKAIRNGVGLYDTVAHLWWRDQNHPGVFWSRGNGWAFAAMAEILTVLPGSATGHAEYVATFQQMAAALAKVQRSDGFWNSDLGDPTHFAGPETSGTALFAYGLAWGIRHRLLDQTTYQPVLVRAWRALSTVALHATGLLGYVQPGGGVSAATKSTYTADYGVGAFLLAGDQVAKLAK